jgi:hypothetical protein
VPSTHATPDKQDVAVGRVGDPDLGRERLRQSRTGAEPPQRVIELHGGKASIGDRRVHGHLVNHLAQPMPTSWLPDVRRVRVTMIKPRRDDHHERRLRRGTSNGGSARNAGAFMHVRLRDASFTLHRRTLKTLEAVALWQLTFAGCRLPR